MKRRMPLLLAVASLVMLVGYGWRYVIFRAERLSAVGGGSMLILHCRCGCLNKTGDPAIERELQGEYVRDLVFTPAARLDGLLTGIRVIHMHSS